MLFIRLFFISAPLDLPTPTEMGYIEPFIEPFVENEK